MKRKGAGKSILAKTVALSMVVGTMVPMSVSAASYDISGHWAEKTISDWQAKGMIGGYEDGSFKPDKAITRAEFVRLINQALGFKDAGNVNFSDVSSGDWYYNDVAIAMGKQYCSGFPDGTFQPNAVVTRAQAASFVANAKGLTLNAQAADSLADSGSIADWAKGAIGAVIGSGYMSGYPDGSFQGDRVFTRAEAVSTLDRVINGVSSTPGQNDPVKDDTSSEVTDTSQAKAPDGYSGHSTGRKGSSGGGGGSSSGGDSSSTKENEISSSNAAAFAGRTLRDDATIYIGSGDIVLDNVTFNGDVKVIDENGTSRAAITDLFKSKIIFKGGTQANKNFEVHTSVLIITESTTTSTTAKHIRNFIAKAVTGIAGNMNIETVDVQKELTIAGEATVETVTSTAPLNITENAEIGKVTAKAPVTTEAGTKVDTITAVAGTDASVDVKGEIATIETSGQGTVSAINIGGSAQPDVKITSGATVDKVGVSETAKPKVTVESGSTVSNMEASGSSQPTITLDEGAKMDKVVSTSTGATEIKGTGEVGSITATNPDTVKVADTVKGNTEVKTAVLESMSVTSQPTTLSYKAGDKLSLAGLVVTLNYDDGTKVDVAAADFSSKDLTAAPADGTVLAASHNEKPVTITHKDGKTATTANLIVTGGSVTPQAPQIALQGEVVKDATTITITGANFSTKQVVDNFKVSEIMNGDTKVTLQSVAAVAETKPAAEGDSSAATPAETASAVTLTFSSALPAGDFTVQALEDAYEPKASAASNTLSVHVKDTDATLASVTVKGIEATTDDNTAYTAILPKAFADDWTIDDIKVAATSATAEVVVKDVTEPAPAPAAAEDLKPVEKGKFTITVTPESGEAVEYTLSVKVNAQASADASLASVTVAGEKATKSSTAADTGVEAWIVDLPAGTKVAKEDIVVVATNAAVTGDSITIAFDDAKKQWTIAVTPESGAEGKVTHTLTVREASAIAGVSYDPVSLKLTDEPKWEELTDYKLEYSGTKDIVAEGTIPYVTGFTGFNTQKPEQQAGYYGKFSIEVTKEVNDAISKAGDNYVMTMQRTGGDVKSFAAGGDSDGNTNSLVTERDNRYYIDFVLYLGDADLTTGPEYTLKVDWDGSEDWGAKGSATAKAGEAYGIGTYTIDFSQVEMLRVKSDVTSVGAGLTDKTNWTGEPDWATYSKDLKVPTSFTNNELKVTGSIPFHKGFEGFDGEDKTNQSGYYARIKFGISDKDAAVITEAGANTVLWTGSNPDDLKEIPANKVLDGEEGGYYIDMIYHVAAAATGEAAVEGKTITFKIDWDGDSKKVYEPTTYTLDFRGVEFKVAEKSETGKVTTFSAPLTIVQEEKTSGEPEVTPSPAPAEGEGAPEKGEAASDDKKAEEGKGTPAEGEEVPAGDNNTPAVEESTNNNEPTTEE